MFTFGGNGVSAFFVGLVLYAATSLVAGSLGRSMTPRPRTHSWLLAILAVVVAVGGVVGPMWFAGMPVIAPGVGLDEQVSTQTPLGYSMSGLAQFGYLVLALFLVHLNQADRFITRRAITAALTLGVIVAFGAFIFQVVGLSWPTAIFDNFPGNFYAKASARLRAQFAEPSQLGAFSLVALAYFLTSTVVAKNPRRGWGHAVLAGASAILLVASYSGTAIVGLVITVIIGATVGVLIWVKNGATIPPLMFIALCVVAIVAIWVARDVVEFVVDVVEGKYGGTSFRNRGLANEISFDIFVETNGLGVGIGNNRASSLFPMLLSTIGVAGVFIFLLILLRAAITSIALIERLPIVFALTAQMAAAFTSLADFASPFMWTFIAACYVARPTTDAGFEIDRSGEEREEAEPVQSAIRAVQPSPSRRVKSPKDPREAAL